MKHFLKIFLLFTGMIVLGLLAVYVTDYFDKGGEGASIIRNGAVAK